MGSASGPAVGIIGAGNLGQAFARLATRAGRAVVISHRGTPDDLKPAATALGPGVSSAAVAVAATQPIVVLAVRWPDIGEAIKGVPWEGRILIDACNAATVTFEREVQRFAPVDLGDKTSSEVVAGQAPGARVVKAANTLEAATLAADPRQGGGNRVLFLSSDDDAAKAEVAALFTAAGFFPIDLGGLAEGGRMQQMLTGPLAGMNLVKLP